jgi:uroporphyrin-III C-methyltransferase/precorrin-2 dehydrogenase/sirohydrochlorin ferrochelatase
MATLLPVFLNLEGRKVVLVGGGPVAASKLTTLGAAGAAVTVVAPEVHEDIERAGLERAERSDGSDGVTILRRQFVPADLDDAWLVIAAATQDVNRQVADAAEGRTVFVNAVDDPPNATAYLGGIVRRGGVTLAISTSGDAPALAGLLREALDAVLPDDVETWLQTARAERAAWRRDQVPMERRRPLLLEALNRLYEC